ncbi:MAG: hypothetical protein ABII64_06255 [Elusimicrobiota bacterium]
MAKDDNVGEILIELNKTLSKLTGKQLKVATVEFKAPSKEALAAAARKDTEKQKKEAEEKQQAEEKKPEAAQPEAVKPEPAPQKMLDPHEEKQKPAAAEPAKAAVPPAKKEPVKGDIPAGVDPGQVLNILCFHPAGSPELVDVFFASLEDVLHKTTKKKFYLVKQSAEAVDYAANDLKTASIMCKDMNADAVFFISKDPVELEFTGTYIKNITVEQVKKRFFYIDLVVELVLAKKK